LAISDRPLHEPLTRRQRTWWRVALLLGMSLAVAATAKVECRDALLGTGHDSALAAGVAMPLKGGRRCTLELGRWTIPLPSWVDKVFGLRT
jgi:hypothetical protein